MRHIIPISGKDSLATAILQTSLRPEHDYEFVFNPTGLELPEVFDWIHRVGIHFGKEVSIVSQPLKELIEGYNYFLPGPKSRYCTRESKIEPFEKWIGTDACVVYYGIRADEPNRVGYDNSKKTNIQPAYPLRDYNVTLQGVYILVNNANLKPPAFFWPRLHERVAQKLGYNPRSTLPEWVFDMLFAGRSRSNCDRCFNQRLYEWVWLHETHPDRFAEAMDWESKGTEGGYTWINGKSLQDVIDSRHDIFERRANAVAKAIVKRSQMSLFDDGGDNFVDILSFTSCGLFCGK